MNHVELHNELSETFKQLKAGKIKIAHAKEIFNGAGKIINNARNELLAIQMGIDCEVPLLDIKKTQIKRTSVTKRLKI